MKIIITGAFGSVGEAVLGELAGRYSRKRAKPRIICIDKANRMVKSSLTMNVINGDVCAIVKEIEHELTDTDAIIHLAAVVHDPRATPDEYTRVNYGATKALADAFRDRSRSSLKQFIYISTVAVFGDHKKDGVYSEEDECRPETPYGKSKLAGEEYIRSLNKSGEDPLNYTILRPVSVYGVNDKGNVGKMIRFMRRFHFFPVFDNSVMKSFIYVKDVARAIVLCLDNERAINQTYDLSARPITVRDMVETIKTTFNIKAVNPTIPFIPFRKSKIVQKLTRNNIYLNDKMIRDLEFNAVDFHDGLARMAKEVL